MLKKILLGILVLLVAGAIFVYLRLRPSGDINKYRETFVDDNNAPVDSSVSVTFFGVSTLLIDDGQTQILIDGFFSRYSMRRFLFTDLESDTAAIHRFISKYGITRLKGIFVTHSHYDHAFDAGHVARETGAVLFGSSTTLNIGRGADLPESQLEEYQPNKDLVLGDFIIRVVPSKHSPGLKDEGLEVTTPLRQPAHWDAYPEGGSFDFLINHHGKKIFIKPSPNFIPGALDSLKVDVAFLGIATVLNHGNEWATQFYEENVSALDPSLLVPLHWDNFFEPISDDLQMLPKFMGDIEGDFDFFIQKTRADSIDFKILQGTKSIVLFQ